MENSSSPPTSSTSQSYASVLVSPDGMGASSLLYNIDLDRVNPTTPVGATGNTTRTHNVVVSPTFNATQSVDLSSNTGGPKVETTSSSSSSSSSSSFLSHHPLPSSSSSLLVSPPFMSSPDARLWYIRQRYHAHLGHDVLTLHGYLPYFIPMCSGFEEEQKRIEQDRRTTPKRKGRRTGNQHLYRKKKQGPHQQFGRPEPTQRQDNTAAAPPEAFVLKSDDEKDGAVQGGGVNGTYDKKEEEDQDGPWRSERLFTNRYRDAKNILGGRGRHSICAGSSSRRAFLEPPLFYTNKRRTSRASSPLPSTCSFPYSLLSSASSSSMTPSAAAALVLTDRPVFALSPSSDDLPPFSWTPDEEEVRSDDEQHGMKNQRQRSTDMSTENEEEGEGGGVVETYWRSVVDRRGEDNCKRPFLAAGSVKSSVFNLSSATLGAGALALPFAIRNTGLLLGVFLLVLVAYLSMSSTACIINVLNYTELKTLEELAAKAGGRYFAFFVEANIIFFCFGIAVGYLISMGDIVDAILHQLGPSSQPWLVSRPAVLSAITVIVLLPLCLTERLEALRFTSFLGVAVIMFVVLVVSLYFLSHGLGKFSEIGVVMPMSLAAPVRAAAILVFAFSCQANVPGIYCELENQNSRRMVKVSTRSVLLCLLAYLAMGIFGFLTFGIYTQPNILTNLDSELTSNYMVLLAFVGMSVAIAFAYPMNIFPCRFSIEMLLFLRRSQIIGRYLQVVIGAATVGLSLAFALLIPSISLVFQLVGATSGAIVSFILPGYFYIKLLPGRLSHHRKLRALLLIVFGLSTAILGSMQSILDVKNLL